MFCDIKETYFSLFNRFNSDPFFTVNNFSLYQEAGKTPGRPENFELLCSIIRARWDVNSLYLYCLMLEMPSGFMIRHLEENDFKPQRDQKYIAMFYWLDYIAHKPESIFNIVSIQGQGKVCPSI